MCTLLDIFNKPSPLNKAAEEAAISRLYGGIHYRSAIDLGLKHGRSLGNYVLNNLDMKTNQEEIASK